MNTQTTAQMFNTLFEAATPIEFNHVWTNGTGYFDNITDDADIIESGSKTVSFKDNHGRRVVGLVTPTGVVALFERYLHDGADVLVSNTPSWRDDRKWSYFEAKTETSGRINTPQQVQNIIDGVELIRNGKQVPIMPQSEELPEYMIEMINREFA